MLGSGLLNFPKLVVTHLEGGKINLRSERPDAVHPLYRLDWTRFDERVRGRTRNHGKKRIPPLGPPFPQSLEERVQEARFAIDDQYFGQILSHSWAAAANWATAPRNFDTLIRETTVEPAFAHVRVAFKLLADCTYDEKSQFFDYSGFAKVVLPELLVFRFWLHQTGDQVALDQLHELYRTAECEPIAVPDLPPKPYRRKRRKRNILPHLEEIQVEVGQTLKTLRAHLTHVLGEKHADPAPIPSTNTPKESR